MRIENLIFDLDGTLVNSLPGIEYSVDAALRQSGLPQRAQGLRDMIGPPIRTILAAVANLTDESQLSILEQQFRSSYDSEGWRKTPLFEGALDTLEKARLRGIHMFIATNKPERATHLILEGLGISTFFQDVLCRDSTTPPFTSKAALLSSLLERHGVNRETCLFVGDTCEDLEAANVAGLSTAIISHGYGGRGLRGQSGYLAIHRFQELPI